MVFTPADAATLARAYESAETDIDEEGSIGLLMESLFSDKVPECRRNKAFMPLTYATFGHITLLDEDEVEGYDAEVEAGKLKDALHADAKAIVEKYGALYTDQVTTQATAKIAKLFLPLEQQPNKKKNTKQLLEIATLLDTRMHGRVAHLKLAIYFIRQKKEFTRTNGAALMRHRRLIKRIEKDMVQLLEPAFRLLDDAHTLHSMAALASDKKEAEADNDAFWESVVDALE